MVPGLPLASPALRLAGGKSIVAANDLSNYDRTHNAVNEITGWTKSSTSVGTIAYDDAGQMTQNDRYQYVYDGFGRLVALKDASDNPIATYGYNGLGFRIWERPDGGDKRFFCYDERWRIVATFEDTNATPTRRVIHHAAGLAGMGGSSYIDSVILEDANDSGDANLEARYYPLQNWRADVVCVGKLSGGSFQLVEGIDYDTYGNAVSKPPMSADYDDNGGVDGADEAAFFADFELGLDKADVDLNGGIDGGDLATFFAAFESGITPVKGACGFSGCIAGYAGYVRDRFAPNGDLYHVRHRVYDTRMGTWTKRDPLGYVDGMGLYEYCGSRSVDRLDSDGTTCAPAIETLTPGIIDLIMSGGITLAELKVMMVSMGYSAAAAAALWALLKSAEQIEREVAEEVARQADDFIKMGTTAGCAAASTAFLETCKGPRKALGCANRSFNNCNAYRTNAWRNTTCAAARTALTAMRCPPGHWSVQEALLAAARAVGCWTRYYTCESRKLLGLEPGT